MLLRTLLFCSIAIFQNIDLINGYEPPDPTVVFFEPKGFEVSIPTESGITLFAFHGNKNRRLKGTAAGIWNKDIVVAENGRLTYIDWDTKFEPGDILYFWIHVIYNGLGYNLLELEETATKFEHRVKMEVGNRGDFGNKEYEVPIPIIEVFPNKGFQMSIPDEEDISLVAFHIRVNEPFQGLGTGIWDRDVVTPENGYFTFRDRNKRFNDGDIIYYWIHVIYNGVGYNRVDGSYTVRSSNISPVRLPSMTIKPEGTQTPSPIGCHRQSVTMVNNQNKCSGELLFEENFNDNLLDTRKWFLEYRFGSIDPDNEFVFYSDFSDNLFVTNGIVHIKPTLLEDKYGPGFVNHDMNLGAYCTAEITSVACQISQPRFVDILPPIISSRFSTKKSFHFLYGKVEIRAKLPSGDWIFPQLFLESVDSPYSYTDLMSGQMRVAFVRGGPSKVKELSQGILLGSKEPMRSLKMCSKELDGISQWSDDFHVYTLEWRPDGISTYIDGNLNCDIRPENGFSTILIDSKSIPGSEIWETLGTKMAPFDREFYLTIGVGVGGHNDFAKNQNKPWSDTSPRAMRKFWKKKNLWYPTWHTERSQLLVDYVRVYAL